jgi:hypothetical protein
MSFVLGLLLFVGLVGALDARVPWPRPAKAKRSAVAGESTPEVHR